MSIKPILFNTEMVRAIFNGRKTQTRRVVKEFAGEEILSVRSPDGTEIGKYGRDGWRGELPDRYDGNTYCVEANPPCKVGDILWVRETFCEPYLKGKYSYRADYTDEHDIVQNDIGGKSDNVFRIEVSANMIRWHPSIHMPREAARIFLRVTDVWLERLWDMDEEAAIAEGFSDSPAGTDSPLERFSVLWDKTIKRDALREFGYHANPWVWVIEFGRCEKPGDW